MAGAPAPGPAAAAVPVMAPQGAVPPPGAFKKELMQAKRRESEMAARVTTLEGEVQVARSTSQAQQAHADDLADRLAVRILMRLHVSR